MDIAGVKLTHWSVAQQSKAGETSSGDAALVLELPQGCLLAVIDALGHGEEAAKVAASAIAALRGDPPGTVIELLEKCHEALRRTRGVAMSLAWIQYDDSTLTWLGIGNVNGILLRAGAAGSVVREHLLCRGGTVGAELPPLRAAMTSLAPEDTLLFYTDGVEPDRILGFSDVLMPPDRAAPMLLRECAGNRDDALVLVARYQGRTADKACL